jgi:hypothetical protein
MPKMGNHQESISNAGNRVGIVTDRLNFQRQTLNFLAIRERLQNIRLDFEEHLI